MIINYQKDIKIQIIDEFNSFVGLENIWNKLLKSSHFNSIFLTYQWFSSFITSFELVDKLFIIVIYVKNDPVCILPLYRDKFDFLGIKFYILQSITNLHTPKFNFIIRPGYEHLIEKALVQSVKIYPWNLIQLHYINEGSYLHDQCHSNIWKPFSFRSVEKLKSPHLIINCNWHDYWHNRIPKSLRNDIKRLERQAHEKFGIKFGRVSGGLLRSVDLDEAFLIEDSGWKGKIGTSILQNTNVERFYREIAFSMNELGYFELFFLSLGGKMVAFEYCLKYDSYICPLKIGYAEKHKRYGLGNILRKKVIRHAFINHYQKYDLLGSADPYKLKWTNGISVSYSVYIFNRNVKSFILKFCMFGASDFANKLGIKGCLKYCYLRIKGILRRKQN